MRRSRKTTLQFSCDEIEPPTALRPTVEDCGVHELSAHNLKNASIEPAIALSEIHGRSQVIILFTYCINDSAMT